MSTKLIQTKDYLLLIDEEAEIKEGDLVEFNCGYAYNPCIPFTLDVDKEDCKILIAYYPLTEEAKKLDLPLLPPFKERVDIEKLALETTRNLCYSGPKADRSAEIFIWMSGYKAAQSKQFSLEDVQRILKVRENYLSNVPKNSLLITIKEFIQSLSTQQLPKEFIPEYEYQTRKGEWKEVLLPSEWFGTNEGDNPKRLKIITNSEGKEKLVGTYKY